MRIKGATLEYSTNGSAWTSITDLDDFDDSGLAETTMFDNTTLDSPGDTRREEPGEWKLGQVSGTYLHKASVFSALESLRTGKTLAYWRYTLPKQSGQSTSGDKWTFRGYLVKHTGPKASSGQNQRALTPFTVQVAVGSGGDSDLPAFTAGS